MKRREFLRKIGAGSAALVSVRALSVLKVCAQAAVVPNDGEWIGLTSQGHEIFFTVSNSGTTISVVGLTLMWDCSSAGDSQGQVSWGFGDPITNGDFVSRLGLTPQGEVIPGSPFLFEVPAEFISATQARGTLVSNKAIFTGMGTRTGSCLPLQLTWSAEWAGVSLLSRVERQASPVQLRFESIMAHPAALTTSQSPQKAVALLPNDGRWLGITSQGNEVSFTVSDFGTKIQNSLYRVTLSCPKGGGQQWSIGSGGEFPIQDAKFRLLNGLMQEGKIGPGSTFVAVIPGTFTSPTTVEGSIRSTVAAFKDTALNTELCPDFGIKWSGEWVGSDA